VEAALVRTAWHVGEIVHDLGYFAPETRAVAGALGVRGGWMTYFGCRAAPLGAVSAATVTAAGAVDTAGRPLAAANAALPVPTAAHLALWQALTTLREHRGDGHVALLVARGITPVEAHVLAAASGRVALIAAVRPLADRIVAAGAVPVPNPVGVPWPPAAIP
jgi:hypothetical protein